jgi:hypothetical protein
MWNFYNNRFFTTNLRFSSKSEIQWFLRKFVFIKIKIIKCKNSYNFFFSWFSIFLQLSGLQSSSLIPDVKLARNAYKRPSVSELIKEMRNSTSFIVARNPIERLGKYNITITVSLVYCSIQFLWIINPIKQNRQKSELTNFIIQSISTLVIQSLY